MIGMAGDPFYLAKIEAEVAAQMRSAGFISEGRGF